MMKFRENEDAVSPVIGVILMVAITVILAAVIAAFVFGMGSNIGTTKTVAVTASQNDRNVIVTYHGGADAATLDYLTVTVTPGDTPNAPVTRYIYSTEEGKAKMTSTLSDVTSATTKVTLPVGASETLSGGSPKQDHVVVTGHFLDGSDHVVLDTYV
jgi:flagellin-like protein